MSASEAARLLGPLRTILTELVDGASSGTAWVLNPGDRGLLASLDALSAEAANAAHGGGSSIAAHADHLRYGLELLNRWIAGEGDVFSTADYSASWRIGRLSADEWRTLRMALAREAHAWLASAGEARVWDETSLTGVLSSTAHLAYHLGAIRQIDRTTRGPSETTPVPS